MFYSHPYYHFSAMNSIVISSARGDVNGDGIADNVYLTGIKTTDSPFIQKITLVIQDGRTGMINCVPLASDTGYNPSLFLGAFTDDGILDIFISIASGGSGGIMYYYIYSDVGNIPKLLFDYSIFNEAYQYKVTYEDYYRVRVLNITPKIEYILDITYKGKNYLNEIYDTNGKLKAPIEGFVNPLSGLYPVDFDSNGVYALLAYQRIAGRYNADGLGYVQTTLKWDRKKFAPVDQYVAIPGAKC